MNLEVPLSAKESLLSALASDKRDPFPVFLRFWSLTLVPWLAGLVVLAYFPTSALVWVLVALLAGFTQNALGILMHEGSHFFFHRQKKTSDRWCNPLVCLPIFNTVQGYRNSHFEHHRTSGEPADPYFELYAAYPSRRHLLGWFALDIVGLTAVLKFWDRYRAGPSSTGKSDHWLALPALLLIQAAIAALLWWITGKWFAYVFLWLLPLMTIPVLINRFRTIVEHYPGFQGIKVNRTSVTGIVEYLCVAPYGYGFHLEHHLLPQIPYYELGFAHAFLKEQGVMYTDNHVNQGGYFQTFRRLIREMGSVRSPR